MQLMMQKGKAICDVLVNVLDAKDANLEVIRTPDLQIRN